MRRGGDGQAAAEPAATAEAVARRSYGKLVAYLAAQTRDVAAAEDALADAFAAALAAWPGQGVPLNPEAWLLVTARRKLIDAARRRSSGDAAGEQLAVLTDLLAGSGDAAELPDRRLALLFACAHPAIDEATRAPLMLQTVLGFDATAIAGAFLTSPAAMSKRLVRAKEKIRQAGIPFHVPEADELAGRLDFVLDAIYATFAEGWADAAGTDVRSRDLTDEALYLARLLALLLPDAAEALGLLALMLHAQARRPARRRGSDEYVPLASQDTSLWNRALIDEAEALLQRAAAFGAIGRYQIEAALQSAHVDRVGRGIANWDAVVRLYDALVVLTGSPVARLNRALAVAERDGAAAGLALIEDLAGDIRLAQYQPYWAARADLLARTGARHAADHAYEVAIGLEKDLAVRRFLEQRRAALG